MSKTEAEIQFAINAFLENWDRDQWMQDHGEWASAQWEVARDAWEVARNELVGALESLDGGDIDSIARSEISELVADLEEAGKALNGQVCPDESDYIAAGGIDPDGVSDKSELVLDDTPKESWDCREWVDGYRSGDALYMRWVREALGERHARDLWVLVDPEFFAN